MADTIPKIAPRRKTYPWAKWTNGKVWRARQGRDFQCPPVGFRATIYSHAERKSLDVTVSIKGDVVEFQFTKPAGVGKR